VLLRSVIFIVDEREKALVLQFGQVVTVKEDPGIAFKLPLIQEVVKYDDRILSLDTQPLEVTPLDDRRLVVDAFTRYRISNVVQFRQAIGVGGIQQAEVRLNSIINAALREVLGSVTSDSLLSQDRVSLMTRIRDEAVTEAASLGVQVIDVRIRRADLPQQNLAATFARMQAERERLAADERARGNEAAQKVRAGADRQAVELVSKSQRDADIIRGEADARRNAIFAEAFGKDPEFFAFYRSLTAYERSLQGSNSTMVISPDSEFFDFLSDSAGRTLAGEPAANPE
jgi:membrane protease subunit HflC